MEKLLIAVEYKPINENDSSTFEIFGSIQEAYRFGMSLKKWQKRTFFIADFNEKRIFTEEDGELNYEDFSDLYDNCIPLDL